MNVSTADTTSLSNSTSLPMPPEYVHAKIMRSVYIWVLVALGVPGNLACLLTVLSMHVTTATFYVALLAAADTLALLLKLLFHQLSTHRQMTAASCYFHYTPSFASCCSNWILALICFERFFAVCFPLKKQVYFTKRKVHLSAAVLTLALGVAFAPTFFMYEDVDATRTKCVLRESLTAYKKNVWSAGLLVMLYFFIPFLLVAIFTTLIIVGLHRHRRARQAMRSTRPGNGGGGSDGGAERAISIMLLCAGLVFLLLTLPSCLYHLFLGKLFDISVPEEKAQSYLLYQVVIVLSEANHSVNFVIYFLSAAKFRSCFMQMVKRYLCTVNCKKDAHPCSSEDATHLTQVSHPNQGHNGVDARDDA